MLETNMTYTLNETDDEKEEDSDGDQMDEPNQ